MAIRPFGYNIENGKYVINPSEAEAVRDYYKHIDSYLMFAAAFTSKWNEVIVSYLNEINDKDADIIELITNSSLSKDSGEIVDKDTWEKVQAIINSRK